MNQFLFSPTKQFIYPSGKPLDGGKIYVYVKYTNILAELFDADGNRVSNPVILDSNGRATVKADDTYDYKLDVYTNKDVLLFTANAYLTDNFERDLEIVSTDGTVDVEYSVDGYTTKVDLSVSGAVSGKLDTSAFEDFYTNTYGPFVGSVNSRFSEVSGDIGHLSANKLDITAFNLYSGGVAGTLNVITANTAAISTNTANIDHELLSAINNINNISGSVNTINTIVIPDLYSQINENSGNIGSLSANKQNKILWEYNSDGEISAADTSAIAGSKAAEVVKSNSATWNNVSAKFNTSSFEDFYTNYYGPYCGEVDRQLGELSSNKQDKLTWEYDGDGNISAVDGSAFAGLGGNYSQYQPYGLNALSGNLVIEGSRYPRQTLIGVSGESSAATAGIVPPVPEQNLSAKRYLVAASGSLADVSWEEIPSADEKIPISAGDNINIYEQDDTVYVSGKDWTDDITSKLDTSSFTAYTANADVTEYSAGANIDITDHVISGKDWTGEIGEKLDTSAFSSVSSELGFKSTYHRTGYVISGDLTIDKESPSDNLIVKISGKNNGGTPSSVDAGLILPFGGSTPVLRHAAMSSGGKVFWDNTDYASVDTVSSMIASSTSSYDLSAGNYIEITKDDVNSAIGIKVTGVEPTLSFGYDSDNAISSINSSALAGKTYSSVSGTVDISGNNLEISNEGIRTDVPWQIDSWGHSEGEATAFNSGWQKQYNVYRIEHIMTAGQYPNSAHEGFSATLYQYDDQYNVLSSTELRGIFNFEFHPVQNCETISMYCSGTSAECQRGFTVYYMDGNSQTWVDNFAWESDVPTRTDFANLYSTVAENSATWSTGGGGGSIDTIPLIVQEPLVSGISGSSAYIGLDNEAINLSAYVPYSALSDDGGGDNRVHSINNSGIYASEAWNASYANNAYNDENGDNISQTYQRALTFGYENNSITSIDGYPVGVGGDVWGLSAGEGIALIEDSGTSSTYISANPILTAYSGTNVIRLNDSVGVIGGTVSSIDYEVLVPTISSFLNTSANDSLNWDYQGLSYVDWVDANLSNASYSAYDIDLETVFRWSWEVDSFEVDLVDLTNSSVVTGLTRVFDEPNMRLHFTAANITGLDPNNTYGYEIRNNAGSNMWQAWGQGPNNGDWNPMSATVTCTGAPTTGYKTMSGLTFAGGGYTPNFHYIEI